MPLPHLRALRERNELTQVQLAERAGVGKSTIVRIEKGKQNANGVTVVKLARALGVTREELLAGLISLSPDSIAPAASAGRGRVNDRNRTAD